MPSHLARLLSLRPRGSTIILRRESSSTWQRQQPRRKRRDCCELLTVITEASFHAGQKFRSSLLEPPFSLPYFVPMIWGQITMCGDTVLPSAIPAYFLIGRWIWPTAAAISSPRPNGSAFCSPAPSASSAAILTRHSRKGVVWCASAPGRSFRLTCSTCTLCELLIARPVRPPSLKEVI